MSARTRSRAVHGKRPRTRSIFAHTEPARGNIDGLLQQRRRRRRRRDTPTANNAAYPMRRKRPATNCVVRSIAGHGGRKASCVCVCVRAVMCVSVRTYVRYRNGRNGGPGRTRDGIAPAVPTYRTDFSPTHEHAGSTLVTIGTPRLLASTTQFFQILSVNIDIGFRLGLRVD